MKKLKIQTQKENKNKTKQQHLFCYTLFYFFTERTGKSELCLIFLEVVKIK